MLRNQINEAITAIIRNRFLSAVTILSIAFILLIFNVLLAVNQLTQETVQELGEKLTLTVYVKPETTEEQTKKLVDELEELSVINSITYQSAADAYKQITEKYPDTTDFLDRYEIANPLPPTISISTKNLEDQSQLIKLFNEANYRDLFRIDANEKQQSTIRSVIKNLINLKSFTFQIVLWVILTFTIGGALLIFNAINITLFSRRQEIQVMQFVGATHSTIRTPFIIEGILYGVLAFLLSIIVIFIAWQFLPNSTQELGSIVFSAQYQLTLILELVVICSVSGIISGFTIQNYLKSKSILAN